MKKKIIFIASISIVVAVIAGIVIFLYPDNSSVERSFINTLTCIQENKFTDEFHYINSYGNVISELQLEEFDVCTASKTQFEILDVEVDNDCAVIEVECTYPNLVDNLSSLCLSDSPNNTEFEDVIGSVDLKKSTIKILLLNDNDSGEWYVVENQDLLDVLSGGLASYYSNREKEIYDRLLEGED